MGIGAAQVGLSDKFGKNAGIARRHAGSFEGLRNKSPQTVG
jgi:hypothetical protein